MDTLTHADACDDFFAFLHSEPGQLLKEDCLRWYWWQCGKESSATMDLNLFVENMLTTRKEFRSLVDYRLTNAHFHGNWPGKGFAREETLHLFCKHIGGGLIIQHGTSSYVAAKSVGKNLWINHNVTIGVSKGGAPVLGDNVRVLTGAVVVGPITVGNNVTITANAVVSCDVPDNSRVYAPRSLIVSRAPKGDDLSSRKH